ncbi:RNA-binding domain-containing protein [Caedibacter taeniospiralis]|jgi:predicted HTH transcriptional regulator|uniref:RNA-binding domain-containing protein n=1 Tax=Caedibacter taeniospiralis TaxID=28907 RepID=UPI0037C1513D
MKISDLIKQKENRKLEFKVELPAAEKLAKTASAFSNSQGGYLIIGVDDQNKVVGVDADKVVEQWGTGFNKIHSIMQDYPELAIEIDDESSFVQVKFIKSKLTQETAQENTKEMVLELLRQNPKYTKSDLMRVLAKADGTIKEHIANLKKEGRLKRVGGTKSGYWEVGKK